MWKMKNQKLKKERATQSKKVRKTNKLPLTYLIKMFFFFNLKMTR